MSEYTHQVLRVVVAQICQTIGWHSIQSTPLELLVDILHKYLQEISRETYRYTELYGRTEPNLIDVGLAFKNLNIDLGDIEEYINYVDPVSCPLEVPKYPVRKESNLNFLKPGSKEVLTRPVHIPEYLPPIFPEREIEESDEAPKKESSNEIINIDVVTVNNNENVLFKKPETSESLMKKPKISFEEEGRPTREISSVMMTSSGFISPAREGKLPDSKIPVLPEYKSPPPVPPPLTQPALPVVNIESKFDKKAKKKVPLSVDKERKREKLHKEGHKHGHLSSVETSYAVADKLFPKKQKTKQKKREDYSFPPLQNNNEKCHILDSAATNENINPPPLPAPVPMDLDIKPKVDEVKLSSEPNKEKLNIFKKISASKKEKDEQSKSPNIFHDAQLLSSIPEGTTITPAPPIKHQQHLRQDYVRNIFDDDPVICVDDEPNYSNLSRSTLPAHLSQNLLPLGTTIRPQTPKKSRKKAQQMNLMDQSMQSLPLNLSSEANNAQPNPINMVKKDLIQNSRLTISAISPPKPLKEKKERKKPKIKESKKDLPHTVPNIPVTNSNLPFAEKSTKDPSNYFKDFNPLNPKITKSDPILPSSNPNPYVPPNFPNVAPIPMFPFYPFPPRPGLIPNPGLFPPLQSMPDNPAFNKFLPMMRFGNFNSINKGPRLTSTYDDEPLPPPAVDLDKNYCNVAPLVPDSMKLQLSPTSLKPKTSIFGGNSDCATEPESVPNTDKEAKPSLDAPIEISDDESVARNSNDEKSQDVPNKMSTNANVAPNMSKSNVSEHAPSEDGDVLSPAEHDGSGKIDKRKEKEHKKGKKGKEGKIKKKKDKKDKSKNKDKAEKRKEKEEKKDKDKTKKLKKEKKKDKLRALSYNNDDSKNAGLSMGEISESSALPKITLKLGLSNSPQPDSPDGRKLSVKSNSDDMTDSFEDARGPFDRREPSPELARISPLVTRPPKQKSNSNDNLGSANVVTSSHSSVENRLSQSVTSSSPPIQRNLTAGATFTSPLPSSSTTNNLEEQKYSQVSSEKSLLKSEFNEQSTPTNCWNYPSGSNGGTKMERRSQLPSQAQFQPMSTAVQHGASFLSTSPYSLHSSTQKALSANNSSNLGHFGASKSMQPPSQTNTFLLSAVENNRPSSYIDAEGNQVWICPACGRVDDGTPMIGCDGCDAWYHWVCVGIQVPPDDNEDWYCRVCIAKKQEAHGADKKRKRKKKNKAN